MTHVRLIGAPTDVGAGRRGSSMGPEALRVAGLAEALRELGHAVEDAGNLAGPANPWQPARQGWRHLDEVASWCRLSFGAVATALRERRLPLLMGGDHSLAIGSISAVAAHCRATGRRLRVLWLDAHADFNTPATTPSGNLHGMPVACLCGEGPAPLLDLGGRVPALDCADLRQVGIRSVDPGERQLVHAYGLEVYDMRFIDEHGMRETMERALSGVDAQTHLHLSFDLDFLDPEVAPGVATPVRGGPSYREAQLCMEMLADQGCLGSLDLMELNPACDQHNRSAEVALDLLQSLFGKSTLMRNVER
jgi:arginase